MLGRVGSNGTYQYGEQAGGPGSETIFERERQERHWRSLGKRIRKGAK